MFLKTILQKTTVYLKYFKKYSVAEPNPNVKRYNFRKVNYMELYSELFLIDW